MSVSSSLRFLFLQEFGALLLKPNHRLKQMDSLPQLQQASSTVGQWYRYACFGWLPHTPSHAATREMKIRHGMYPFPANMNITLAQKVGRDQSIGGPRVLNVGGPVPPGPRPIAPMTEQTFSVGKYPAKPQSCHHYLGKCAAKPESCHHYSRRLASVNRLRSQTRIMSPLEHTFSVGKYGAKPESYHHLSFH